MKRPVSEYKSSEACSVGKMVGGLVHATLMVDFGPTGLQEQSLRQSMAKH